MIDLKAIRDGWLGSADVRARIGRWPIGRRIADRHVRRLFGIVAGFAQSQMLFAALELGVFDHLRDGPRRWEEIIDLDSGMARTLRQALAAIGLIEDRRSGRTGLTIDGLVIATDPGLQAMIRHNQLLYADLADPVAVLRGDRAGRLAAFWPYDGGPGDPDGYAALMAESQGFVADSLLASVDFETSRHVLDVGGGDGRLAISLTARHPHLDLTLVDLPRVVALARHRGLDPAIEAVGVEPGDPLPRGADTILLVRVLHDRDDAEARTLLTAVAAALPPDGRVVIAEPMARDGYDPQTSYFAAYFAAMRSGRLRSAPEIESLLHEAGLKPQGAARHPSPLLGVIMAGHHQAS